MRKRYDFIFSIGSACSCTEALRAAGLQHASFPFDWITVRDRAGDVRERADAVFCGFAGWFERNDFEYAGTKPWHLKDFYRNRRTGIVFNHEFPKGVSFDDAYPKVRERYDRRFARLDRCIRNSKSVLLVRIDRPDQEFPTAVEDCVYARTRLSAKYPDVNFDVLLMSCESGRSFGNRRETTLAEGVTLVAFDYRSRDPNAQSYTPDMSQLVGFLRQRYKVRDYRTPDERKAARARRRLARYKRYGVTGGIQLFRHQASEAILSVLAYVKAALISLRPKTFRQIVPLGCSCEAACRMRELKPEAPATLFDRATTDGLDHLIGILRDPNAVFSGDMAFDETTCEWRCLRTGLRMRHGLKWHKPGSPPPQATAIAADRAGLLDSLPKLKAEFASLCKDGTGRLFVVTVRRQDAEDPGLDAKLQELKELVGGGSLLVVSERGNARQKMVRPGIRFRTVRAFASPYLEPFDPPKSNRCEWRSIFAEFRA